MTEPVRSRKKAIGASLASLCGLWFAGSSFAQSTSPQAAGPDEARQVLAELVAIDTSGQNGTSAAVEALRARFLRAGFPASDIEVVSHPSHPRKANLIVRLRGRGGVKPLLYMAHLDVVPAKDEDWSHPPFQLVEEDGWLYGRGVLDVKGEIANLEAALVRLRKEQFSPAGDIVAIFNADEEAGGADGIGWLSKARPDLFDARLVLNPDAPVAVFRDGKRAYYGVQTSEKRYVTFRAEVTNRGGHSSEPRPDNAIYQLARGLARLADHRFPVALTPTVKAYYAAQASFSEDGRRADMALAGTGDAAAANRLSHYPADNAQVRTTCVATMLNAGSAENALPQRANATIQCRLIPGESLETVQASLSAALAEPGIKLSVLTADPAGPESVLSRQTVERIEGVVHSLWPRLPVVPVMDAGASDSLFTRSRGTPTFGVPSIFVDLGDMRAHGRDERITSKRFIEGGELAYRLMKEFASVP